MIETYYVNDDITFKGRFYVIIDGKKIYQTPDGGSALVYIINRDTGADVLAETSASIDNTIIFYKYTNLTAGAFRLFFTAKFNSGEDERTAVIDYNVKAKDKSN